MATQVLHHRIEVSALFWRIDAVREIFRPLLERVTAKVSRQARYVLPFFKWPSLAFMLARVLIILLQAALLLRRQRVDEVLIELLNFRVPLDQEVTDDVPGDIDRPSAPVDNFHAILIDIQV